MEAGWGRRQLQDASGHRGRREPDAANSTPSRSPGPECGGRGPRATLRAREAGAHLGGNHDAGVYQETHAETWRGLMPPLPTQRGHSTLGPRDPLYRWPSPENGHGGRRSRARRHQAAPQPANQRPYGALPRGADA